MPSITTRKLQSLRPESKPYFMRDSRVQGFAVKVNPSGTIRFIAEVWHEGRSVRKTLGTYPMVSVTEARQDAILFISKVRQGKLKWEKKQPTLRDSYEKHINNNRLKPNTIKNYRHVVLFYLSDWLDKPVNWITKEKVEERFYLIRDKGIGNGKPTLSQAVSSMRYLSSILNNAMVDGQIDSNPIDILKQKRIDRSVRKREHYLPASKVRELLNKTALETHPGTLAVHLMLFTGLRKNEALRLNWSDIQVIHDIPCIVIEDTKNHRPHYIPVTEHVQIILDKSLNTSDFIFPSPQRSGRCLQDVRPTLKRLTKLINMEFKCHDLRRTFATRASEVGIDYLMIKRMLNHKSNDITGQYIQWNSRQNLQVLKHALEMVQY